MRVLVKYRSMSTSVGRVRNGDIIDIPEAEYNKICVTKPAALEILPELPLEKPAPKKRAAKKAPVKRKRARNADGTLKGDDPSTPDVNEAWVNVESDDND
jgi:hypothetical protein